tara:strand:+ start:307 stop:564 length:258 start_codon:yes stop_codon:yes gene_type:complete
MNNKIEKYIRKELKSEPKHCIKSLAYAAKEVGVEFDIKPMEVIRFMLGDKDIGWTHSYGFHTRYGRSIRYSFESRYNEIKDCYEI